MQEKHQTANRKGNKIKHSDLGNGQPSNFAKLSSISQSHQKKLNAGIKDGQPPPIILLLGETRDLYIWLDINRSQVKFDR